MTIENLSRANSQIIVKLKTQVAAHAIILRRRRIDFHGFHQEIHELNYQVNPACRVVALAKPG